MYSEGPDGGKKNKCPRRSTRPISELFSVSESAPVSIRGHCWLVSICWFYDRLLHYPLKLSEPLFAHTTTSERVSDNICCPDAGVQCPTSSRRSTKEASCATSSRGHGVCSSGIRPQCS